MQCRVQNEFCTLHKCSYNISRRSAQIRYSAILIQTWPGVYKGRVFSLENDAKWIKVLLCLGSNLIQRGQNLQLRCGPPGGEFRKGWRQCKPWVLPMLSYFWKPLCGPKMLNQARPFVALLWVNLWPLKKSPCPQLKRQNSRIWCTVKSIQMLRCSNLQLFKSNIWRISMKFGGLRIETPTIMKQKR